MTPKPECSDPFYNTKSERVDCCRLGCYSGGGERAVLEFYVPLGSKILCALCVSLCVRAHEGTGLEGGRLRKQRIIKMEGDTIHPLQCNPCSAPYPPLSLNFHRPPLHPSFPASHRLRPSPPHCPTLTHPPVRDGRQPIESKLEHNTWNMFLHDSAVMLSGRMS